MASAEPSSRPMLEEALAYLKLGYPIFPVCTPLMGPHTHPKQDASGAWVNAPCTNPGKVPMVRWQVFQSRLPTAEEVRASWGRWPAANIGMATGVLSGVVVLDCDSGEARQLAMERGGLDKTPAVWTGKIGGIHYWLAHPVEEVRNFTQGRKSKVRGLDFRGDGGYVLLPPSVHREQNRRYRWVENTAGSRLAPIPPWLMELLRDEGSDALDGDGPRESLDIEEMLRGFDEGHRDDGLFRFACRLRHDDYPQAAAEALVAQAARACRPSFDEAEAVAKVRYVYRKYEAGSVGPTLGDEGWFSPPGTGRKADTEAPPQTFLRPISELLAMPEVEPDWLVDQLFTAGSNGWVAAEPKVGKSWVVLELAYALSTGTPFLGRFGVRKPRRVIYVQEEDSLQRVLRRLKKIIKGDATRGSPPDDFWRWSIRAGFKIDSAAWMETLRQEIEAFGAEVIILDVFNRLHGSDENKQAEMTAILNALTALTNRYGCAFIIVHHNRKPQSGNEARGNQMMRGSGVLAGWAECSLYLRKSTKQHTFIVTPESKDAPEIEDFTVTLRDLDNGGVLLDVGEVTTKERISKIDADIVSAVERSEHGGKDATAQRIAEAVGRDRTTVQKRLKGLVESGMLDEDTAEWGNRTAKIYTVATQ